MVFNSHTIVYERSHPIRNNRLDMENGITYVVAGGAGAMQQCFHHTPAWHTAHAIGRPHFVQVSIAGTRLELQAIDNEGNLLIWWLLSKDEALTPSKPVFHQHYPRHGCIYSFAYDLEPLAVRGHLAYRLHRIDRFEITSEKSDGLYPEFRSGADRGRHHVVVTDIEQFLTPVTPPRPECPEGFPGEGSRKVSITDSVTERQQDSRNRPVTTGRRFIHSHRL